MRGGLDRVSATGMYLSIGHVEFPKFQTGIFDELKALKFSKTKLQSVLIFHTTSFSIHAFCCFCSVTYTLY